MATRRQQKVGRLIQKELADIFQKKGYSIIDSAMITISEVIMTPDLMLARVYLSIFNAKDKSILLNDIQSSLKEIRFAMGNRIGSQLRKVPELEFFLDESLDDVYKMEQIFKDINPSESTSNDENG
jgi:ribosome-binding factor A